MAQNIGKRRGKSPIKTRLEQERKAARKDPKGKKAFTKGLSTAASFVIPGGIATKATPIARKAIEKTITKVQAKRNAKKMMAEIDMDPAIRNFDQATKDLYKTGRIRDKKTLDIYKEEKVRSKKYLKDSKKKLKKETSRVRKRSYSKNDKEKYTRYEKEKVAENKKVFKAASKKLNEERFFQAKSVYKLSPTVQKAKKIVKKAVGPVVGVSAAAATYKSKNKGGFTNTVPPKRGPQPQGYKNGADVDFFAAGNEDFQYGGGKASYTFDGKKSSITPSLSASAYKVKDKSIKGKLDRVSVKGEYKPNKKVNLKGEVSRNVHGKKDYRAMLGAEYKNKNKKFKGSIDQTGRANFSFSMGFKHGGCPHREIGVKSDIKGVSGIQVKGQKFTGSK